MKVGTPISCYGDPFIKGELAEDVQDFSQAFDIITGNGNRIEVKGWMFGEVREEEGRIILEA